MTNGKGDATRPRLVSREMWDENYERVFGRERTMLEVIINLYPGGVGHPRPRNLNEDIEIGSAIIANDASGSPTRGNYRFLIRGKKAKPIRQGNLADFPRKQLLAWDLLYRILKQEFGDRNEKPKTT